MINSRKSQCSRLKETAFIIRYFAEILKELSIQAFKCFLRLESFLGHNPMRIGSSRKSQSASIYNDIFCFRNTCS